ncbi:MAG: hypothetical protein AAFX02_07975, partial [Pseudomonadota bacterium]
MHDDASGNRAGDTDILVKKSDPGYAEPLLCESAWRGRAEFGGLGNNAFSLKISADGSALSNALIVDEITSHEGLNDAFSNPQTPATLRDACNGYTASIRIFDPNSPGNCATRFEILNSVSNALLQAYGSVAPGRYADAAAVVAPTGLTGQHIGAMAGAVGIWANNFAQPPQLEVADDRVAINTPLV